MWPSASQTRGSGSSRTSLQPIPSRPICGMVPNVEDLGRRCFTMKINHGDLARAERVVWMTIGCPLLPLCSMLSKSSKERLSWDREEGSIKKEDSLPKTEGTLKTLNVSSTFYSGTCPFHPELNVN